MTLKVLVIERNVRLREERRRRLVAQGCEVLSAADLEDALPQLQHRPDLVLLCDCAHPCSPWMCAHILRQTLNTRYVAVTHGDRKRTERALGAGVDACTTDPVAVPSLTGGAAAPLVPSWTKGHSDGNGHGPDGKLELHLDEGTYQARLNGAILATSATEFRLLALLVRNAPRVVPRGEILAGVWGPDRASTAGVVRLYIYVLRRKLVQAGGDPNWIRNVPGLGYAFCQSPLHPGAHLSAPERRRGLPGVGRQRLRLGRP